MPAKEFENDQGEKKWAPFLFFREKEHMIAFNEEIKKAIDKFCESKSSDEKKFQNEIDEMECPF